MMSQFMFSYDQYLAANAGGSRNGFDYLQVVNKISPLTPDFFRYVSRLFLPDFVERDGYIYLLEVWNDEIYSEYKQSGLLNGDLQFWMNLIEITGLFDQLNNNDALDFARALEKSWNFKLVSEFGDKVEKARVMHDEDTGEIFITIGTNSSGK